jgi:hypothetical protein
MSTVKRPPEAFQSAKLWESGVGYVVISRFKGNGSVEAGVFLLDTYCLGVKNGFFTRVDESEYEEEVLNSVFDEDGRIPLSPACARKLVESAIQYAQSLGFAPHPDYKAACRVLGGISSAECTQTFTFGKDGKPFYVQGPYDTPERAHRILALLEAKCGEGNYDYLIVAGEEEF